MDDHKLPQPFNRSQKTNALARVIFHKISFAVPREIFQEMLIDPEASGFKFQSSL